MAILIDSADAWWIFNRKFIRMKIGKIHLILNYMLFGGMHFRYTLRTRQQRLFHALRRTIFKLFSSLKDFCKERWRFERIFLPSSVPYQQPAVPPINLRPPPALWEFPYNYVSTASGNETRSFYYHHCTKSMGQSRECTRVTNFRGNMQLWSLASRLLYWVRSPTNMEVDRCA